MIVRPPTPPPVLADQLTLFQQAGWVDYAPNITTRHPIFSESLHLLIHNLLHALHLKFRVIPKTILASRKGQLISKANFEVFI